MANFNLNKVILGGRLTSDVELKQTQGGIPVAQFSIAVNRKYQKDSQQETDFISCVAWRSTAEFISRYFKKGSSICVVGSIQVRSWDQNGQKRYATEVVIDEATFVDSKASAGAEGGSFAPAPYVPDAYKPNAGDDDLPF